ncbi:MAG: SDR family NAD(P)-dependent oxidoreductase, partial [Chthoniobacterales bacterium]
MNSKQKRVAIVTGVSGGIGLGITLAFIKHGYDVVGTSRSISESKGLKASSDLVLIDGDISKKETAAKVAEAAIEHFGRIDLLVNNAGIFLPKPFTEYAEDDSALAKFHPLGRMAEISDVVDAVLRPEVGSVASLFISRWDAAVMGKVPDALNDQLGIAIGERTCKAYRDLIASPRWRRVFNAGGRPQRLLFASTGTKDPKASDVLYIKE